MEERFVDCSSLEDIPREVGEDFEVGEDDGDFCQEEFYVDMVICVVFEKNGVAGEEHHLGGYLGGF